MKASHFIYLSALHIGVIGSSFSAYAQTTTTSSTASISPSIHMPSELAYSMFGDRSETTKELTCYVVLFGLAGYQNAQAQGACYEAQTACLRLGLFQEFLTVHKTKQLQETFPGTPFTRTELEEQLQASMKETKLKLMGCAVAIVASAINDSVIDQTNFKPPKVDLDTANLVPFGEGGEGEGGEGGGEYEE